MTRKTPIYSLIALLALACVARAERPALLEHAIQTVTVEEDHWAYTRTTLRLDSNGQPCGGATIERYNPAVPLNEQWGLVRYQGRIPTESDVYAWRRQKLNEMKAHDESSFAALLDLDHATLISETETIATFRVPFQNLDAFLRIDRTHQVLTIYSIRPRTASRAAAPLTDDGDQIEGRLESVDSAFPPTLVSLKTAQTAEVTFSGFRRVRPYNDRFAVNIGQLRSVD